MDDATRRRNMELRVELMRQKSWAITYLASVEAELARLEKEATNENEDGGRTRAAQGIALKTGGGR
jgi:hypothetical protein